MIHLPKSLRKAYANLTKLEPFAISLFWGSLRKAYAIAYAGYERIEIYILFSLMFEVCLRRPYESLTQPYERAVGFLGSLRKAYAIAYSGLRTR